MVDEVVDLSSRQLEHVESAKQAENSSGQMNSSSLVTGGSVGPVASVKKGAAVVPVPSVV